MKMLLLFLMSTLTLAQDIQTQVGSAAVKAQAKPFAQIISLEGSVDFNDHSLFLKEVLRKEGIVETKAGSRVKIYFFTLRAVVILNEKSHLEITLDDEGKPVLFQSEGVGRYVVEMISKHQKSPFVLHTEKAVMTSKGADFLLKTQRELQETEVLGHKGKVMLESKNDSSDKREAGAKEWVGLGGRFGLSIASKITYPEKLFEEERLRGHLASKVRGRKDPLLENEVLPEKITQADTR